MWIDRGTADLAGGVQSLSETQGDLRFIDDERKPMNLAQREDEPPAVRAEVDHTQPGKPHHRHPTGSKAAPESQSSKAGSDATLVG